MRQSLHLFMLPRVHIYLTTNYQHGIFTAPGSRYTKDKMRQISPPHSDL